MRTMIIIGLVFSILFLVCFFMVARDSEMLGFDDFAPMGFLFGVYMVILTGWLTIKGIGKPKV